MKNTISYTIAKFVCSIFGVDLIPPTIKTINISNNNMKGDVDLSQCDYGENVIIDLSENPDLKSISLPSKQINSKTKIYINGSLKNIQL